MSKELEWEYVYDKFVNLVKFASKQVYEVNYNTVDNAIATEDLFQIGMLKLYDVWEKYKHLPENEFKAVFNVSLFRTVRKAAETSRTVYSEFAIDNASVEYDYDFSLEFAEGIEELETSLNCEVAYAILQELIEPSPRTLFEVWADKARKEHIKSEGKRVNIPKNNDVKMKHIKSALEITQKQFDMGILEIRTSARYVFGD